MFASGSDCGPTNPLQNFGKHAGETSSSQRERFVTNTQTPEFRSTQNKQARQQLNNDFQAFNNGNGSQVLHQNFGPGIPSFQHPQHQPFAPHHQEHASTTNTGEWANEFSKLSLRDGPGPQMSAPSPSLQQQRHPHQSHQIRSTYGWNDEFASMNSVPTMAGPSAVTPNLLSQFSTAPNIAAQTEHQQQHHLNASKEAEMRAFEDAFDQVQRSLDQTERATEPEHHQASHKENEDLSKVAETIVSAINGSSTMSEHTSRKLKNSHFMDLMQQISEKKVSLDGEKFVDQSGSDVGTIERAKQQEMSTTSLEDTEGSRVAENPEGFSEEQQEQDIREQPVQLETPSTPEPADIDLGPRLPDSVIYGEKEGVLSSLLAAQELGPQGLARASEWEENYDEWFA